MSSDESILRADALSLSVDGTDLLSDISLTIPAAARVLIRGESGAGKTTLFNVLGLLEPPTDGSLYVNGTDTATLSERQRAQVRRDTVGIVFQDFKLIDDLTARENAALPQEHVGERDEEWLDELFERLDISNLADSHPRELSGGEKQRVAIARALANRPDVVLADEPTGQLDPATEERVLELLFDLHESTGVALVVISHDPRLADRFDRVVRLEDGRISHTTDDTTEVTSHVD
ncbi:ABC transporter ATP-binding protein [Natronomonas halophila]|uniref:ABC transporter ATP-binding protein n=1 Tax=Natronomonas halophila TaxID=2747817 RepID=UPI0015B6EA2A|nr:ABC transporter ATP-binding protein [Natronomonas halophila]QLD87038.1 ABC transporter ATP-binding protein [Natronomonas halophila]